MSMSEDMLRRLRADDQRLRQTETKETPGGIGGFTSFYASGTYVPTYLGGTSAGVTTYTTQQGGYIRVGGLCVVTGTITWTAATGTGNAQISLPFASKNVTNQNHSGSLWQSGVTFANSTPQILIAPGTSVFVMTSPLTNAGNTAVAVEAAGTIVFTVSYIIA